mgnify:CR=1 FL=1
MLARADERDLGFGVVAGFRPQIQVRDRLNLLALDRKIWDGKVEPVVGARLSARLSEALQQTEPSAALLGMFARQGRRELRAWAGTRDAALASWVMLLYPPDDEGRPHLPAHAVDNLGALASRVERIAQKHVGLNILPEHYPAVAESLLVKCPSKYNDENMDAATARKLGRRYSQIGPIVAGPLMQGIGLEGLFLYAAISVALTALAIVREKELGTLEQLNVTPITRAQFIAAKLLPFWVNDRFFRPVLPVAAVASATGAAPLVTLSSR